MNQRIGEKIWMRLNPDEKRKIIINRGWSPGRYPSNKKRKNNFKRKKNNNRGGLVGFLRNYIMYPYKTKTKTFGKGKMITAMTKIVVGNFGTQTVVQLSEIAFSMEYLSLKSNFLYYKILGIGLTFMPQNKDITENLYFMINWDGEPLANFRINDNVNVVPPYIIKPKTFYFKVPRLIDYSGVMNFFRQTSEMVLLSTLQLSCPDNTIDWSIRVDVIMEFRSLNVRTVTNKYLFVKKEDEEKFDDKVKDEEKIFKKLYDEAIEIKKNKIKKYYKEEENRLKLKDDEYFLKNIYENENEEDDDEKEEIIDEEEIIEDDGKNKINNENNFEKNEDGDDSLEKLEKKLIELKKKKEEIEKTKK